MNAPDFSNLHISERLIRVMLAQNEQRLRAHVPIPEDYDGSYERYRSALLSEMEGFRAALGKICSARVVGGSVE